jgi:2,4-dienoyl-CoA reductase-like NADH-dependent reductase (Old Yellow Enzyme family)
MPVDRSGSILFTPIKIGGLAIPNRFVRSATHEYMAEDDGTVTPRLAALYRELAEGEIGLLITGHFNVLPEGQASPRQTGIFDDRLVAGLKTLPRAVYDFPTRIFAQLAHAGRQTKKQLIGGTPIAPSAVFEPSVKLMPREAGAADIARIIDAFVQGSRRAHEAGFDGVQLHAAHGYLLSAFLSPYTNRRTDEWGGSTDKRARIVVEIIRAIKDRDPLFPLIVKLNSDDFLEGGLRPAESVEIARLLEAAGLDGIEVSGGTAEAGKGSMWAGLRAESDEGYFVPAAERIKAAVGIPVFGLGGNRTFAVLERFVRDGRVDLVSLSRPLIHEPHLVKRFRLGEIIRSSCISCNKCLNPRGISCGDLKVQSRQN